MAFEGQDKKSAGKSITLMFSLFFSSTCFGNRPIFLSALSFWRKNSVTFYKRQKLAVFKNHFNVKIDTQITYFDSKEKRGWELTCDTGEGVGSLIFVIVGRGGLRSLVLVACGQFCYHEPKNGGERHEGCGRENQPLHGGTWPDLITSGLCSWPPKRDVFSSTKKTEKKQRS